MRDNRWCLICNARNRTLYWHLNSDDAPKDPGGIWCFCNKCDRGYSLKQYCEMAGIDEASFIEGDFHIQEAQSNEVQAMSWPHSFIPLSDPRAEKGTQYIKSRGLSLDGDLYYDMEQEGIVFPYYVNNYFCGAQIRFIEPRIDEGGKEWKITTLSGTRIGLLLYGYNQNKFLPQVKGIIVTEGAFNSLALQQALNKAYGGVSSNAWRCIACSGSGVSDHQAETLKDLKEKGYKVIGAFDTDEAGIAGTQKMIANNCLTHFSFTGEDGVDWNDILKRDGIEELAKLFLKNVEKVDVQS